MSGIQIRNALLRLNFIFMIKLNKRQEFLAGFVISTLCEHTINELDKLIKRALEI